MKDGIALLEVTNGSDTESLVVTLEEGDSSSDAALADTTSDDEASVDEPSVTLEADIGDAANAFVEELMHRRPNRRHRR